MHATSWIRINYRSRKAAANQRHRPRGHSDRRYCVLPNIIKVVKEGWMAQYALYMEAVRNVIL
jgi:hypothetical protein